MNPELSSFATRLRRMIDQHRFLSCEQPLLRNFEALALELFALQFQHNLAYQKICLARGLKPETVRHWTRIPAVPTSAFKELELTSIPIVERTTVFHSSGTTEQKPSRHFHCADSLKLYEASLWRHFQSAISNLQFPTRSGDAKKMAIGNWQLAMLTPSPEQVPHSSLVHMFENLRQRLGEAGVLASRPEFYGKMADDSSWTLDFDRLVETLAGGPRTADHGPCLLLGTAFSFVHLLDYLAEQDLRFELPGGSRVMETGGYKNRSRSMPKAELHALITERLGVTCENILCEYGMSELSSQAYDAAFRRSSSGRPPRVFHFPPWARAQIISPETGIEEVDGETGLIRIFDLANVFSVAAIQTEDLGVRRGKGFELIGRAQFAEPRGCSLMNA